MQVLEFVFWGKLGVLELWFVDGFIYVLGAEESEGGMRKSDGRLGFLPVNVGPE